MHRSLLPLLACSLAVMSLARATEAIELPPRAGVGKTPPVEMRARQVGPHSYYVQGAAGTATENEGFVSNAGFVVTDAGVVVFDALGSPALAALLLERIREVTAQPVVKVVVSHYHADHVYGLQVFEALGAEVLGPVGAELYLGSPQAVERLEERRFSLSPWVNEQTRLVAPDRLVAGTEQFELGGVRFTLSYLGSAHSDGDLALLVDTDGVLFSGDVIFEGRVPFLGNANTKRWLETLEGMERGGISALVPGHGAAASDPNEAIAGTRRYLAFMREQMGAAVADLMPFEEAYAAVDWSEFAALPAFEAANRRNAYQVYLSMEAEALK